jgi:hypothetical protein
MFKFDFRNIKNLFDYNIYLINQSINYNFKQYVRTIHSELNKTIDITNLILFLDYSLKKDSFIITKEDLLHYELIENTNNEAIVNFINTYNLIQHKDYAIRKILRQTIFEYKFTPYAFKRCLIKKSNKYIDYYMLLEEYLSFYIEYKDLYNKKLEIIKDIKLDKLIKTNETLNTNMQDLHNRMNNIEKNMNINQNMNDIYYKIDDISNYLLNQNLEKSKQNKCGIYKTDINKYLIIDAPINIYDEIYNMKASKHIYIDKKIEYNYKVKKFNVFYKLINKFKNNIKVNNIEIELIDIELEDINKYIIELLKI